MSDEIDDGGPAFPCDAAISNTSRVTGMSLRDWFAGQALAGICATLDPEEIADLSGGYLHGIRESKAAYCLADAMLRARRKGAR